MKLNEFLRVGHITVNNWLQRQGVSLLVNKQTFDHNLKYVGIVLQKFEIIIDQKKSNTLYVLATGWKNNKPIHKNWAITVEDNTISNSLFLRLPDKKPLKETKIVTSPDDILW